MQKLKYRFLLFLVGCAGSTLVVMSQAAQAGRRAVTKATAAAALLNRPVRVIPTWQQTPVPQQATLRSESWAKDSSNRSLLTTASNKQRDSGNSSFWKKYQNLGLWAALASLWTTKEMTASTKEMSNEEKIAALQKRADQANEKRLNECGVGGSRIKKVFKQVSPRVVEEEDLTITINRDYPKCARALNDFYSAHIALLQEKNRQSSESETPINAEKQKENLEKIESYKQLQESFK